MDEKKPRFMSKKQIQVAVDIFNLHLKKFPTQRAFSYAIDEDCADIYLWKTGRKRIRARAVVTLARLFNTEPYLLRPDVFDNDIKITFLTTKEETT